MSITLDEARGRIGAGVVYQGVTHPEDGVITSVNDRYVFVQYRGDFGSKATLPQHLSWLRERAR